MSLLRRRLPSIFRSTAVAALPERVISILARVAKFSTLKADRKRCVFNLMTRIFASLSQSTRLVLAARTDFSKKLTELVRRQSFESMPCSTTVHWKKFISTYVYRRIWLSMAGRQWKTITKPSVHAVGPPPPCSIPLRTGGMGHLVPFWVGLAQIGSIRPYLTLTQGPQSYPAARTQDRRHDFPYGKKCCTISSAGLRHCSLPLH